MTDLLQRLGGASAVGRLAGRTLGVLLLIVLTPLLILWPFGRDHAPNVAVHDEEGILQVQPVVDRLEELRFRSDVDLEVLTLAADYNANFNDEVLAYARAHQPQWISAKDPNYWADGLVLLAVSSSGRWVGTYFGEDVKVGTSVQEAIQDAGKDAFREGDWAKGVVDLGRAAATEIGKPVRTGGLIAWTSGLVTAASALWLANVWRIGLSYRSRFKKVLAHYANVTRDWETTELLAGTIPADEPHGAEVLSRYASFRNRYHAMTKSLSEMDGVRGAGWFDKSLDAKLAKLLVRVEDLDAVDDSIAHTSALLCMDSGWEDAWRNELGPIYEDLASFRELCNAVDKARGVPTDSDREWLRSIGPELDRLTADLGARTTSPSAALDRLDEIADALRSRSLRLSGAAIQADGSEHSDRRRSEYESNVENWERSTPPYSGSWKYDGHSGHYEPSSTIRTTSSSAGDSWSHASGSSSSYRPLAGLVTGYTSAAAWSPPSTSDDSSSGGSSFSGGGFSGAGSSSHF
mgnify:CR=1 FL=1